MQKAPDLIGDAGDSVRPVQPEGSVLKCVCSHTDHILPVIHCTQPGMLLQANKRLSVDSL